MNNYFHKAGEDLYSSLKTMEEYGLYPEAQKQMSADVTRIEGILRRLADVVDSDGADDTIAGDIEPLESACMSVEAALDEEGAESDPRRAAFKIVIPRARY